MESTVALVEMNDLNEQNAEINKVNVLTGIEGSSQVQIIFENELSTKTKDIHDEKIVYPLLRSPKKQVGNENSKAFSFSAGNTETSQQIMEENKNNPTNANKIPTYEIILDKAKKNIFNELTQASIKILQSPHLALKIFWIVSILLALAFCSLLVVKSITEYLSYQVTTNMRMIYENPTLFPKVTICNKKSVTTEYGYNLMKSNISLDSLNSSEYQKLSHFLRDSLFLCSFSNQQCNSDDFSWIRDAEYGSCYVFNSGFNSSGHQIALKETCIAGLNFGLQLVFYTNYYEKLADLNIFPAS